MMKEQVPATRPNGISALGESKIVLSRITASVGDNDLGVSRLPAEGKTVTFNPGYTSMASCESAITFIDGGKEILCYRGYPVEQLTKDLSFLEVAYLLIYGELPDAAILESFIRSIQCHHLLHEDFKVFFVTSPRRGYPMAILQAGIAGLIVYYESALDPHDSKQLDTAFALLPAKVPTMISYTAKQAAGLPLLYSDLAHGYIEDFIRMTLGMPYWTYGIDPALVHALDMLLILRADHKQNCSTSIVRLAGSSQASLYASVAADVGAFAGPLHGGANEAALWALRQIRDTGEPVQNFVDKMKPKAEDVHLMSFGYHIYRGYDPRAAPVKETAHEILSRLGKRDELLDIAMELGDITSNDDYFKTRKLYPNVDFYIGLIYSAIGFPTKIFTLLFALGRLFDWIFQYVEMMTNPTTKIGRPRRVYVGEIERDYVSLHMHAPRFSV